MLGGASANNRLDAQALEKFKIVAVTGFVHLVYYQKDGLAAFEGHFGHAAVLFGDWHIGFYDNPDNIGAVGSLGYLFLNRKFKVVFGIFHAGGVDQPEVLPFPFGFGSNAVAGGTRFFGDNGFTAV